MANTYGTNESNTKNVKDEIINKIQEGVVEVQQVSDETTTTGTGEPGPVENPATEPGELPETKPEIEPENIPKENPGIDPGTQRGDDEDEIREPPIQQPAIIMAAE